MTRRLSFFVFASILIASSGALAQKKPFVVGVTLHPYYSWVKNIVGDTAEVRPVIPASADPHSYQVQPQDLANLENLDAVVVNYLGHDDFVRSMLKAAGKENVPLIKPNEGLALIPLFQKSYAFEAKEGGEPKKTAYNSHTYLSVTSSIQQINTITAGLVKLRPEHAALYRDNALTYTKRLRKLLGDALKKIDGRDVSKLSIATVHDGYAYLFQELGMKASAVIQPRHGIEPSARQLADTINQIKSAGVSVLFAEADYQKKYVDQIYAETKCRVYRLSHVSGGDYTADKFENDIKANLDAVVQAVLENT